MINSINHRLKIWVCYSCQAATLPDSQNSNLVEKTILATMAWMHAILGHHRQDSELRTRD